MLTLDGLCERERIDRVDFVKADVEGAELSVLRGCEAALAAHHPTLLLEIEERHVRKYDADAARSGRVAHRAWLSAADLAQQRLADR